jgi:hypothetical protein
MLDFGGWPAWTGPVRMDVRNPCRCWGIGHVLGAVVVSHNKFFVQDAKADGI